MTVKKNETYFAPLVSQFFPSKKRSQKIKR